MSSPVVQLPEAQLRPLLAAYDASVRTRRGHTLLVIACIVAAMLLASVSAEVSPTQFIDNIGRFPSYIIRLFQLENGQPAWTDFTEWFWGLPRWLRLLGETLLMAYVGTLLGAVGAFGLAFLSAANVGPSRWLRFAVRRVCELCRTVPMLVFALLFVIAFGLGPMAGVLAVVIHTLGALGKQFAEVVENIDMKPVEGVSSTGASWDVAMRLRRPAAGHLELRELHAAALRDQRARIGRHGLRRRRRHRPGPDRGDPQVLLFRRFGHPAADPGHGGDHRHAHLQGAPPA